MSESELEQRVEALEKELARLKQSIGNGESKPWWERIAGSFHDDDGYRQAMRLGSEYRESLRNTETEE